MKIEKKLTTYLVGGAVRDELMGIKPTELDYVVIGATPQQLIDLGFKPVGKDFPVFLHPETKAEYALARTERKVGSGYKGFTCYAAPDVTLEEDLKRRDLTINAIAKAPNGQLVDPFKGQQDLAAKLLRHVSPAFIEDPVRILRVARFAARYKHLGFKIAPETMLLMQEMVQNGETHALVSERVWQEFSRALTEPDPQEFIGVLRDCGALAVLFPEIDQLFGVPNPIQWHPEVDTGIHVTLVLKQAALLTEDPITRFAALVHDLGKGVTPREVWPSHPGHEKRGVKLMKSLGKRLGLPRDYLELALLVVRYHGHCHKIFELKGNTLVKLLESLDAFRRPERFKKFLIACEADFRGRPTFETKPYPNKEYLWEAFQAAQSVNIQELVDQGLTGKLIGEKLHQARVAKVKQFIKGYSSPK